ncbi:nucleotide exchange factor GrpE [Leucobacter sp. NPDC058333]|uniref:nucleotide exchange factor GrpE n=1 Tax=Leucobacter sp. NPDC058333 TaxID=3346450 RepID=UPI003653AF9A
MAHEEQRTPGENPNADEVPAQEPESNDSGSVPQPDLTVDDILGAEQSEAAAEAGASADDANNPYLDDLRRLTAEYANYRKRTEANAAIEKQRATAAAVAPMLTVLDDLDRAEKHGDLTEGTPFATIAQKIRGTFERIGVQSFGEVGENFDPQLHEAIAQVPVPGTEQHTVLDVIERGYRIGEVELRPAKVAVAVGADG